MWTVFAVPSPVSCALQSWRHEFSPSRSKPNRPMKTTIAPADVSGATRRFSQRALSRKIISLIAAFVVPLTILSVYFLLTGLNKDINFAEQELRGNAYQRKLETLLRLVPEKGRLVALAADGDAAAKGRLPNVDAETERAFVELASVDADLGSKLQMTVDGLAAAKRADVTVLTVRKKWDALRSSISALAPQDLEKSFTELAGDLRTMIAHVGDKSNLILDPDLDTYYVMDVTLLALPQNQDRLGALARLFDVLPRTLSTEQRTDLGARLALLKEADLDRILASAGTALAEDKAFFGENADFQSKYPVALASYRKAVDAVLSLGQRWTAGEAPASGDIATATATARSESFALWDTSVGHLDALLHARVAAFQGKLARSLAIALGGLLLAAIVAWFVTRSLVGDFGKLLSSEAAARATAEDGKMRLQEQIQDLLLVVSDGSDGKLGVRAVVTEGALGNVADALNLMFENVGDLIASAQGASDRVAQAARQISATTLDLAIGTDTQSVEVAGTTAGVQALNAQAQLVVRHCQAATAAVANARTAAENGALAVREVVTGMGRIRENVQVNSKKIKRLGDRSMEISGIVKAIGEISAKTDMLALNASMEAARAGEQGKGFSVIAEQVRSLAERTRTLTAEIERLVASIQSETAEAVQQMETQTQEVEGGARQVEVAGVALEKIVHASAESSSLVSEINLSATQQADHTSAMLLAVATIHSITENARAKVAETSGTSQQLSELSARLNRELAKFEVPAASGLN